MQDLEREKKKEYWAERERIRKELFTEGEVEEETLSRASRKEKSKESRQRRRRRIIFLLLMVLIAAYLFLWHTPYGNGLVNQVTDLAQRTEGEQATYEEPELQEADEEEVQEEDADEEQSAQEEDTENVYAATMTSE